MFSFYLFIILLNFFILIFYKKISKLYNLFDYPDNNRKIHQKPTPLLGGLFLLCNLFFILIYANFSNNIINLYFFENIKNYNFFFLITFLFYLIGFIDDKYQINHNIKLILSIILIILTFYFDKDLLLKKLEFSFLKSAFNLGSFSYFFTILCFLLFINAFNMLDGINGQATCYVLFIFFLLFSKNILVPFIGISFIALLFFLILNFQNKSFLGDSGTLPLGYMISYIFIKLHSTEKIFLADEIFLIMSIPGYELLRLALKRVLDKKHPFLPDNNHIHHLIGKKYKFIVKFFIIQFILIFPYLFYIVSNHFLFSFLISLFLYILSIIYFYKGNAQHAE
jgi:UDP-GlcNAc:undecaprenyl-phosphate/decaprenyl-phosphate GlcNAc-1-phosphate transferase